MRDKLHKQYLGDFPSLQLSEGIESVEIALALIETLSPLAFTVHLMFLYEDRKS